MVEQRLGQLPLIMFYDEDGKTIVVVKCAKSARPIFLKENNDPKLFVRSDAATRPLPASDIAVYVTENFERQ